MKNVLLRGVIVLILFSIGSVIGYKILYQEEPLKIYTAADLNPKLIDASVQGDTSAHFIGNFSLTNQYNEIITPSSFYQKIYVASFIFTTCEGICPIMTANLKTVYQRFKNDPQIAFISHSVTPAEDSVPVLKAFAEKYEIEGTQWHFVTGIKKDIYDLARKHYFAATTAGDGSSGDFVHTENFILVDEKKRIRGIYDGTSFDDIDQLIEDIEQLKKEVNNESKTQKK